MSKKGLKRVVTAVLAAALMVTSVGGIMPGVDIINNDVAKTASAAKVKKSGDFKYVKYSNGVKITKYMGKAKKVTIPAKIAGKKVVAIGASSFEANETLKQIKMPDSIKEIGENAFADCAKLKKVTLSNKLESIGQGAFSSTPIKKISIPDAIKKIELNTFLGCDKLTKVTLGENVRIIGRSAFDGCVSLSDINLDNIEEIGIMAFKDAKSFAGELALKNIVTVGTEAFYGCTGISAVSFSDTLQVLGERESYYSAPLAVMSERISGDTSSNPFAYCTGIERFEVDVNNANYTSVDGVIYGKTNEWIVAYPAKKGGVVNVADAVKGISEYAFAGAQISQVNMGKGLLTIGKEAFAASTVTEVKMPLVAEGVQANWSEDSFINCKALRKVVFPEETKSAWNAAFYNCTALNEVVLPEGMETLSDAMFFGCTSLENMTLPKSVVIIPVGCFYGCKSLKNVNLENVDIINSYSFCGCESLTGVLNLNAKEVYTAAFGKCVNITEVNFNKPVVGFSAPVVGFGVPESSDGTMGFYERFCENRNFIDVNDISFSRKEGFTLSIGNPFAGCSKLMKINVLDENGSSIKSVDGVLFTSDMKKLISYPSGLTGKYNVPYGVEKIGESAFEGAAVSEIVMSNSVSKIWEYAFHDSKVKSITFSKSVSAILTDNDVFEGCSELEEIKVHASNENYESIDGVLYEKGNYKKLVAYPAAKKGKTYTVPKKVYISEDAFDACKYLKKVYIQDMKKYNDWNYFENCKGIKLYLPKNYNPKKVVEPESGKYTFGFDETCEGCKTYVVKGSSIAKKLDKKKVKYNKY